MKPIRYTLLEGPEEPAITLAQVWGQLRLDPEGSPAETPADATLSAYIAAAISLVDGPTGWLNRCLVSQKWSLAMAGWPCGRELRLPLPRLISVESVKYLDLAGEEQTLDDTRYRVIEGEPGSVLLAWNDIWPLIIAEPDAVRIEITAGWATAAEIPATITQALLLLVSEWHENREPVAFAQPAELPFAVTALLSTHRFYGSP